MVQGKLIACVAVAALLGTVMFMASQQQGSTAAASTKQQHGRMALRMDALRSSRTDRKRSQWSGFTDWLDNTFNGGKKKKREEKQKREKKEAEAAAKRAAEKKEEATKDKAKKDAAEKKAEEDSKKTAAEEKKKADDAYKAAQEAAKKAAEEKAKAVKAEEEAKKKSEKEAAEKAAEEQRKADAKERAAKEEAEKAREAERVAEEAEKAAAAAKASKYCANRCETKRIRKDWALMSVVERETYIKAVKKLYDGGVYSTFVRIHQNGINDPYAHGTSAFLPWHRKYLVELEDSLRCLGEEFECVTLPYWDWAEWQYYCNKQEGGCPSYDHIPPNMAAEMAKDRPYGEQKPELVKSIISDFGGPGTPKDGCTADGGCLWGSAGRGDANKVVGCVQKGPFAGWEDWDGHCLSRGIDWKLPATMPGITNRPFTTNSFLLSILLDNEAYGTSYSDGYRGALQNEPHNNQHNYLGGHMRSMRSPMDPIFFTHHAMVDKQWARWQDCHNYQRLGKGDMGNDQYEGNAGRTDSKVGFDDRIDVDMPYFLANEDPFKPDAKKCSEAVVGSNNKCQQCLSDNFRNLRKTWCVTQWDPACLEYCGRDQCREHCGTGGGHRPLKKTDFKLKGDDKYEYMWDHNKLGNKPRDWILGTTKYGKSTYHYQLDAFDRLIGESACEMVFEAGATPAPAAADGDAAKTPEQEAQAKKQVATATNFLQQLDSLESSKAATFNDKIKANLIKLTEKAKKKGGDAGDDKDPAPALVKLAVIKAAKSEMKNQCGLQAKSPMCASLPKDQACAFVCPQDIKELTSKNANSACAFNALFGAPASSNGLKWSSTCKPDYLTDADFAKKQEEKQAVPEGAPAVVAGQKNNEENFPSLPAGGKKTKAAEAGPQGAWKNGPPKAEKKKKDKKKQGEAAEKKPAAVVAGEKVTEENYPSLPGGKKAKAAEPQGAWKKGPPKP